jgi:hypothetical protein
MIGPSLIDFYEITDSHRFEQFVAAYLQLKGFTMERLPTVGADGRKDMIVSQPVGFGGKYRWLVSCKHRTSSTASIGSNDDGLDPTKMFENKCQGALFVYSRPITDSLMRHLETVRLNYNFGLGVLVNFNIESDLVADPRFYGLIYQCFPRSYQKLMQHVQNGSCACGEERGGLYLIPYANPQIGQVEHEKVCGACYSYVRDGLDAAGLNYGNAICISPSEDD